MNGPLDANPKLRFDHLLDDDDANESIFMDHHGAHSGAGGSSAMRAPGLTLKEQEQVLDRLRKENHDLRMKIYFMEERLQHLTPAHMNAAIAENIDLKIKLRQLAEENGKLANAAKNSVGTDAVAEWEAREQEYSARLDQAAQHVEQLDLQVMNLRAEKLQLEDKLADETDARAQAAAQRDLAVAEVDALRTQLEFATAQANGFKQDLMDAGTGRSHPPVSGTSGTPSSKRRQSSRRRRDESAHQPAAATLSRAEYLDKMNHFKAQITAQNLIIASREGEIDRLQTQVATLTRDLHHGMQELESARASGTAGVSLDRPASRSGGGSTASLRIQISEMHRQLGDQAVQSAALSKELKDKHAAHEQALAGLMGAWSEDQQSHKTALAETKRKLAAALRQVAQLQAQIRDLQAQRAHADQQNQAAAYAAADRDAERDADVAQMADQVAQLEAEVASKDDEIQALQTELADRVREEHGLQAAVKALKARIDSAGGSASTTAAHVAALEAEVARAEAHAADLDARWRQEVAARAAAEQREATRIADVDARARREADRARALERQVRALERDRDAVQDVHDRDVAEAADAARRAADVERAKEFDEYKRQVAALDRAHKEARDALANVKAELKARDAEVSSVRAQLARWQAEAAAHHDRLTHLVAENQALLAQSRGQQTEAYRLLSEQYQQLKKQHLETLEALQATQQQVSAEHESARSKSPMAAILYQWYVQLSAVLGKNMDSITPSTPASVMEDVIDQRLRDLAALRDQFTADVRAVEAHWSAEFKLLLAKLDRKTAQADKSESAIRTATAHVKKWKVQVAQLQQHVKQSEAAVAAAEAVAQAAQAQLGEAMDRHGDGHWVSRVREMEAKLRETEERIRRERSGAREKVQELIGTVRELERQLESAKKMNFQYHDLIQHQKSKLEAAMHMSGERKFDKFKEEYLKLERTLDQKERALNRALSRTDIATDLTRLRIDDSLGSPTTSTAPSSSAAAIGVTGSMASFGSTTSTHSSTDFLLRGHTPSPNLTAFRPPPPAAATARTSAPAAVPRTTTTTSVAQRARLATTGADSVLSSTHALRAAAAAAGYHRPRSSAETAAARAESTIRRPASSSALRAAAPMSNGSASGRSSPAGSTARGEAVAESPSARTPKAGDK
ncbi:hypothetical protein AMAG_14228 [Allomyces macrogynus ATCC 38327]|uniref:Centrosomin N-terminal motif 1 domain-containing protein n=1 Tax=Allomyces macrogynus (strain ATCC 38327) TaxID=578462 RepID=A0A0L0T4K4_ALLM3|nr:hypothetical protein AMAG_14228 [Allomyces macrogynus ATCC 38327]|eukprot:KNE69672.1 hypothetical protein AMAG_14228 [Allomyces macrogynus ATCC 38327]